MIYLKSFFILFSFVDWFKDMYHDGDAKIEIIAEKLRLLKRNFLDFVDQIPYS